MTPADFITEAWDHRALVLLVALVGLLAFCVRQHDDIVILKNSKPAVVEHLQSKIVKGPERVIVKTVTMPGGETIVTRYIDRASETIDKKEDIKETPIKTAHDKRWIVGAGVDPLHSTDSAYVRGGVTIFNRLDLSLGHTLVGPGRAIADVAWRF